MYHVPYLFYVHQLSYLGAPLSYLCPFIHGGDLNQSAPFDAQEYPGGAGKTPQVGKTVFFSRYRLQYIGKLLDPEY